MSKILFDKKRKKRIIHIAGHGKRQRLRKNTLFLKCLHLNCDSQLYILSHPSIHKNPLPGGFLCLLGIFYLFETIGRRGVSQSKCPEGGTRLPSGSWAGDGMPRITCVGKLPNGRFPLLNQESFKTVQVLSLNDAFQIEPVLPVFLHLHAAPLPHGGGQAQLIIRQ